MTPGNLKVLLQQLDLGQAEFALLLGASPRSGQYWTSRVVPPIVATIAELLKRRPELLQDVRAIADARGGTD